MPKTTSKPKISGVDPDYVRMYFQYQVDRINKHEEQSLNITNIVLTISAAIITFGFSNKQSVGSIFVLFLPVVIVVINLFAILHIRNRGSWISQHQVRARRIMEKYVPDLYALDQETIIPIKRFAVGKKRIQNVIHFLFILIGVALLAILVMELLGVSIP